jgi:hypothetical protein
VTLEATRLHKKLQKVHLILEKLKTASVGLFLEILFLRGDIDLNR